MGTTTITQLPPGTSLNGTELFESVQDGQSVRLTAAQIAQYATQPYPVSVSNGGTGSASLTGYVKGAGITPLQGVATIPLADISGAGTAASKDLAIGTSAPSSPDVNDLWVDTSSTASYNPAAGYPVFASPPALLSDSVLSYAPTGDQLLVQAGMPIITSDLFAYTVAASDASDHHVTTAGGVRLYVLPDAGGMNVRAFGAQGDGVANDTAAIQAAALAGAAENKPIYAPAGTYKLTAAVTFSTGLAGDGPSATVFQGTNLGTASGVLITVTGGGVYDGFTVDGACSADPAPWNSLNYDSFTGWRPLFVSGASRVYVKNVIAQNSAGGAPIRVELCQDISFENCQAIRGRGQSGDGFYTRRSRRVNFLNCRAYDVTRIGFVCEGVAGGAIEVCEDVTFTNCHAEYAHDQSVNYGGTEFNAGFWFENSTINTCTGCTAKNTGDRGFTYAGTSLVQTAGFPVSQARYVNCHADTANAGFSLYSLSASAPAVVALDGCSSENTISDFSLTRGKFTLTGCSARKDGGSNQAKCIDAGVDAEVHLVNFYEHWTNQPADVTSASSDAGSVSKFSTNHPKKIVIDNYTTYDGAAFSLKLRTGTGATSVSVSNSRFLSVVAKFGSLDVSNCVVDYANLFPRTHVFISNSKALGTVLIEDEAVGVLKRVNSCEFTRTNEATTLLSIISINDTQKPLIFVSDCNFSGNLETGVRFVRVNSSTGTASAARAHDIYMDGCVLYNTGGTTANVGIELTRADAASRAYVTSSWKSSTITNIATRTATNSTFSNI